MRTVSAAAADSEPPTRLPTPSAHDALESRLREAQAEAQAARADAEAERRRSASMGGAAQLESQLAYTSAALSASERDATEARRDARAVDQRVHDAVGPQRALISRQEAALAAHATGLDSREIAVRDSEARLRQQVAQWRELMEACTTGATDAKRAVLLAATQLEEERVANRQWQQRAEAAEAELEAARERLVVSADQSSLDALHARFGGPSAGAALSTPMPTPATAARGAKPEAPMSVMKALGTWFDGSRSPAPPHTSATPAGKAGAKAAAAGGSGAGPVAFGAGGSLLSQPAVRLLLSEIEALQANQP